MTYRELIRELEAAGWNFFREGRGSHQVYRHPDHSKPIVIAHGGKLSRDIPEDTKNAIRRQAGLK